MEDIQCSIVFVTSKSSLVLSVFRHERTPNVRSLTLSVFCSIYLLYTSSNYYSQFVFFISPYPLILFSDCKSVSRSLPQYLNHFVDFLHSLTRHVLGNLSGKVPLYWHSQSWDSPLYRHSFSPIWVYRPHFTYCSLLLCLRPSVTPWSNKSSDICEMKEKLTL